MFRLNKENNLLRSIFLKSSTALAFLILTTLFVSPSFADTTSSNISVLAQNKYRLTRRLDSLEVHKQRLKRRGKPLMDIEKQSNIVKDSIETLREQLVAVIESTKVESSGYTSFSKQITGLWESVKPAGIFEWAILFISLVSSICVIILLWGIIQAVCNRKKKNQKSALEQKEKALPQSAVPQNSLSSAVKPEYPYTDSRKPSSTESVGSRTKTENAAETPLTYPFKRYEQDKPVFSQQKPSDGIGNTDIDDRESIESLRRRMADDIKSIQRFNHPFESIGTSDEKQESGFESGVASASSDDSSSIQEHTGDLEDRSDLKNRVIQAAKCGLSKHEISRNEQLSVDQVELILRVTTKSSKHRLS